MLQQCSSASRRIVTEEHYIGSQHSIPFVAPHSFSLSISQHNMWLSSQLSLTQEYEILFPDTACTSILAMTTLISSWSIFLFLVHTKIFSSHRLVCKQLSVGYFPNSPCTNIKVTRYQMSIHGNEFHYTFTWKKKIESKN
jgi:hypothetical protein